MVSTLDFESSDPSSNLGRTYKILYAVSICPVGKSANSCLYKYTDVCYMLELKMQELIKHLFAMSDLHNLWLKKLQNIGP